jgi:polyisoprenoid-binding protein YceI
MAKQLTAAAIDSAPASAGGAGLPDAVWRVDRRRSEIGFAVRDMWGLRTVRGEFTAYLGSLEVRGGRTSGALTIEATSLDTGNRRRDRHLRSPAFFDVARHPRITFASTAVTAQDGGLTVAGELVVGESRLRLEIPVSVERMADGALRLEAGATVSRDAAGLDWNMMGAIRGDAALRARLTLEKVADETPCVKGGSG